MNDKDGHPVPEVSGKYGTCYFIDCCDGIRELLRTDQQYQFSITDPPYNVGTIRCSGMNDSNTPRSVVLYDNEKSNTEYHQLMTDWFNLNTKISQYLIFTCGKRNLGFWQTVDPQFAEQYMIWLIPNCQTRGKISLFLGFEPILFWGNYMHLKMWDRDTIELCLNNGFMRNHEFTILNNPDPTYIPIHPHPKPFSLWESIITRYRPKSVLDCFGGSGLTARLCEMYHIRWTLFEINPVYRPDIEWNIKVGQANPRTFIKKYQKKCTLDTF